MNLYYRRDGTPITNTMEWARLIEDHTYQVVKQTVLPGGQKWVSTVWLGLGHSFGGGMPLIFETMVFGRKDLGTITLTQTPRQYKRAYDQRRWATEAEAIAGHAELCRYWRCNRATRRKIARTQP